jgi:hypothetical protein
MSDRDKTEINIDELFLDSFQRVLAREYMRLLDKGVDPLTRAPKSGFTGVVNPRGPEPIDVFIDESYDWDETFTRKVGRELVRFQEDLYRHNDKECKDNCLVCEGDRSGSFTRPIYPPADSLTGVVNGKNPLGRSGDWQIPSSGGLLSASRGGCGCLRNNYSQEKGLEGLGRRVRKDRRRERSKLDDSGSTDSGLVEQRLEVQGYEERFLHLRRATGRWERELGQVVRPHFETESLDLADSYTRGHLA